MVRKRTTPVFYRRGWTHQHCQGYQLAWSDASGVSEAHPWFRWYIYKSYRAKYWRIAEDLNYLGETFKFGKSYGCYPSLRSAKVAWRMLAGE